MRVALVVLLFVLSMFGGRLVQLQGLDAPALVADPMKMREARYTELARRGDITDSSGQVLATTVDRRNILVDQTLVGTYRRTVGGTTRDEGLVGAAQVLAPVLGMSVEQVGSRLVGTNRGFTLAADVTPEVARRVLDLKIPGVDTESATRRTYPNGELAANVLGFVAADDVAYGGVEGGFNAVLGGKPGSIRYERGKDGTRIPNGQVVEQQAVPGGSVRLTLDRDLQWTAQRLITEQVARTKAESGSVVVLDPRSGDLLALATAPTFDPNRPGAFPVDDRGDRTLLDVFEPGSTSKVATMAAVLQERKADALTRVTVPNRLKRADRSFRDSEEHGVEQLTASGVLAKSSNIGTILLGEQIPPATMEDYLRRFGLGAKTGLGLPESPGILAPAADWDGSQRFTVLFGQGLSVNTLQAAQVFATIANDGVRVPPRVVAGWTDADGTYHADATRPPVKVVDQDVARTVRQMMEGVVVEGGTAVKAAVPGYRVAGKTGTAQRAVDGGGYRGYTASFIGMAPAEDPALVVAVVLQSPTKGYYGGEVAAPVFQQLMTYALARRAVPPSTTPATPIPSTWS